MPITNNTSGGNTTQEKVKYLTNFATQPINGVFITNQESKDYTHISIAQTTVISNLYFQLAQIASSEVHSIIIQNDGAIPFLINGTNLNIAEWVEFTYSPSQDNWFITRQPEAVGLGQSYIIGEDVGGGFTQLRTGGSWVDNAFIYSDLTINTTMSISEFNNYSTYIFNQTTTNITFTIANSPSTYVITKTFINNGTTAVTVEGNLISSNKYTTLKFDGNSWNTIDGGNTSSIIGINKQISFNDAGVMTGQDNFSYDKTLKKLSIKENTGAVSGTTGQLSLSHNNGVGSSEYIVKQNNEDIIELQRNGDTTGNGNVYSILNIKAPTASPNEATLTTMCETATNGTKFVDWYLDDYPADKNAGVRIQTRGGAVAPPFKIEYHNGQKQTIVGTYVTAGSTNISYDIQTFAYTPAVGDWIYDNLGTKLALNSYITAINTVTRVITLSKPALITDVAGTLSLRVVPLKRVMEVDPINQNVSFGTNSQTQKLNVGGSINVTGNYLVNGVPIGGGLVKVDVPNIATNGNILTASTSVDVATNITFTQTTANITATLLNPTITTVNKTITLQNLVASTQSLTITAVGGDTFSIGIGQSIEVAWNGTSWKLLNPAQVLAETGVTTLSGQFTVVSAAFTDVTGLNVTLPSAGKYEFVVSYMVRNSIANAPQRMNILNTANNILDVIDVKCPIANDSSWIEVTRVLQYTGTAGEVIRVQIASNGTATAQLMSDLVSGQTKIAWKKISGFLPVVGQSVDYGSLVANGTASYGTVMYSVTTATNVSPTAPFASNQTILFNGGTASVAQNGNLPVALATGIQTINKTGVYNIKISASIQANGASDSTVIQLVKNNTTPIAASSGFNASGGNIVSAHNLTYSGTLNAGDTLDVRVGANGAAAHAIYAFSWTTTQLGTSAITTTTRAIVDADLTTQVATTGADINLSGLTELIDTTNSFNPVTGTFVAPRTGFYRYEVAVAYDGNTTDGKYLKLKVNGTTVRTATNQALAGAQSLPQIVLSNIVQLTAGDNVVVTFGHSANGVNTGVPVAIGGVGNHGSYNIEEITATY
jgi:hypothetical protein